MEGETILNWLIMMKETKFATNILHEFEEIYVNIKNNQGITALLLAASKSRILNKTIDNGFTPLVQLILEKGADIHENVNIK